MEIYGEKGDGLMCIIMYHPRGAKMPEKDVMKECESGNPHGAGLMVKRDGWLRLWKGFMTFEDLWGAYRCEGLVEEDEFAVHFRYATAGGVSKGNCHPFPVVSDEKLLRKLKFKKKDGIEVGMMHNGVLGVGEGDLSDTMVFVRDDLFYLRNEFGSKAVMDFLDGYTKGSKLLIFTKDGVVKTGEWNEDKKTGLWFSNYGWRKTVYGYGAYTGRDYKEETKSWNWRGRREDVRGVVTWDYKNGRFVAKEKELRCPTCENEERNKFLSTVAWGYYVTCMICGCRFNKLDGGVVGYNEDMWERYCGGVSWKCSGCGCDAYEYVYDGWCLVCKKMVEVVEVGGEEDEEVLGCPNCGEREAIECTEPEDDYFYKCFTCDVEFTVDGDIVEDVEIFCELCGDDGAVAWDVVEERYYCMNCMVYFNGGGYE